MSVLQIFAVLACRYLTPSDCKNWHKIIVYPSQVIPPRVHVPEGTPVKAYCGSSSPVQWIHGNHSINTKHETDRNSITLHNLKVSDSGFYYCRGTVYENTAFTNYIAVFVHSRVRLGEVIPDYLEVSKNDTVTVYCGSAKPVEWFGLHFNISKVENGNVLILRNLKREHSGRYMCRGVSHGAKVFHSQVIIIVDVNVIFRNLP